MHSSNCHVLHCDSTLRFLQLSLQMLLRTVMKTTMQKPTTPALSSCAAQKQRQSLQAAAGVALRVVDSRLADYTWSEGKAAADHSSVMA